MASLQVGAGCAVERPVTTLKGSIPLLQLPDLPGHPGLLVQIDLDTSVHCNSVYAVLDVSEYLGCSKMPQ